jgi:hypothetical protein
MKRKAPKTQEIDPELKAFIANQKAFLVACLGPEASQERIETFARIILNSKRQSLPLQPEKTVEDAPNGTSVKS